MKILQVHNSYSKLGGEDSVVLEERKLLKERGHTVLQWLETNKDSSTDFSEKLKMLKTTFADKDSYRIARSKLESLKPDVCHVHNIFFKITLS